MSGDRGARAAPIFRSQLLLFGDVGKMAFIEQRCNIKFCQRLGKTPMETLKMLRKIYGESTMARSKVYEWYRRFQEGRNSIADNERVGRPSTARNAGNVALVSECVRTDRRQTVEKIAEVTNLSKSSCQRILMEDLNMQRVSQHIVPRLLTTEQKEERMTLSGDLIDKADMDPGFLNHIITGDETWCFLFDIQPKRASSTWKSPSSPRSKKFRQDRSKGKVMMEVFFDSQGIVHMEFIPEGRTVNKEYYLSILRRLRESIRRKRPQLWQSGDWYLLHDNAPSHRSHLVQQFLNKTHTNVLRHPPYSPDLAPCDFYLFPALKKHLQGRRFHSSDEVKAASQEALQEVAKNGFQECFQKLYERWQKCIVAQGDYFEGGCASVM